MLFLITILPDFFVQAREWSEVLQDLFELRRLCPLILTEWFCIETLANSLLCSENKDNIKLVQVFFYAHFLFIS